MNLTAQTLYKKIVNLKSKDIKSDDPYSSLLPEKIKRLTNKQKEIQEMSLKLK